MIKLENTDVVGWEHAIRGMRNPLNSWDKTDSWWASPDETGTEEGMYVLGENDLSLAKKLVKAGTDHRKFMRMLTVYVDITAPLYWWKEFDTYKVGTVANSCSTMHKIADKEFTFDDFSMNHLFGYNIPGPFSPKEDCFDVIENDDVTTVLWTSEDLMAVTIDALNFYRKRYLETNDKKNWWQLIQLLPSSYNQKRTVMLNYEVLSNIYKSRGNHKLDEWHTFCEWIETLPYSELITGKDDTK